MKLVLRPTTLKRTLFFAISDLFLSYLTLWFAYNLRFNFEIPEEFLDPFELVFIFLAGFKLLFMLLLNHYKMVWRFFSFYDAKVIVKAHLLAYFAFLLVYVLFESHFHPFPRSVIIIDFVLSLLFIGALRGSKRVMNEGQRRENIKPTLIIGANSKTATIIQSALNGDIPLYPIAIVLASEEETLSVGSYIHNIRVFGIDELEQVIQEKGIEAAIIVEKLTPQKLQEITGRLTGANVHEIKKVKLLGSKDEKLEDISIEDLLARHPKDLDKKVIEKFIYGKSILVTGAGGSIGSEITLLCQKFGASALTLVENSEYNLYQMTEKIEKVTAKLLDITDRERLDKVFQSVKPDIVIHAAAYKHVPLCEENPDTAVRNNVLGSKNVIDLSVKHGVQKVVVISTDKAVRPTNVMGATKRVTELYANNVDAGNTEIVAVRFGNVLGSSGSVIPKFKQQIENGGPVTVTHPEITRYFMLIPEACQLVLQAATIAKGGELFILDMGESVKIVDLAKQMIRLYGKENEVEVTFSGLRPGEKLYEELLLDESEQKTKYSSIFIAHPTRYDIDQLNRDIETLLNTEEKVAALKQIVPEFVSKV